MQSLDIQGFSYEERTASSPSSPPPSPTAAAGYSTAKPSPPPPSSSASRSSSAPSSISTPPSSPAGLELTRAGHLALTDLCTCRKHLRHLTTSARSRHPPRDQLPRRRNPPLPLHQTTRLTYAARRNPLPLATCHPDPAACRRGRTARIRRTLPSPTPPPSSVQPAIRIPNHQNPRLPPPMRKHQPQPRSIRSNLKHRLTHHRTPPPPSPSAPLPFTPRDSSHRRPCASTR